MLSASATAKSADGAGRVSPSDRESATAHTASSTPDRMRTNQAMTTPRGRLVALRVRLPRPVESRRDSPTTVATPHLPGSIDDGHRTLFAGTMTADDPTQWQDEPVRLVPHDPT